MPRKYSLAGSLTERLEIAENRPLSEIFSEEPVSLDTFIRDKKFLGNPPLSEIQYNAVRHIEQIYLPETYPLMVEAFGDYWEPVRFINFAFLQWGKGSGKDHVCRIAASRIAYLLLCLNSPQEYFGFAAQDEIQLLNIAMNAAQAHRAFFKPLGTLINNSPWFRDKLASEITDQAKSIRLKKQIELVSGHSEAEGFEGLNLIAGFADEISGFQSSEERKSTNARESQRTAEAVMDIIQTSASTRFPNNYKIVAISYPRYKNDPIQNLCAEGWKDIDEEGLENSPYFVDGPRATWEVNPRIPGKEAFAKDYKRDPLMAQSKYECNPQRASNRFFRIDSAIQSSFPKKPDEWVEPIQIDYYWGVDKEGAQAEGSYDLATVPGWQAHFTISPELIPMEGAIYTLHADLAIKSDRAGISMCHVKNWERREHVLGEPINGVAPEFLTDNKPVIKVDFVTAFEADLEARNPEGDAVAREVQPRWFRSLIRELKRRGFTIGMVTFDQFQSADSIQLIAMYGIPTDKLSIDINAIPYNTLRDVIYDGRLEGYYHPILLEELEGLSILTNKKIDHPPGGSKDMADALCGAVYNALEAGGDEGETPEAIDLYGGQGFEINGGIGVNQSMWGNLDFSIPEDIGMRKPVY